MKNEKLLGTHTSIGGSVSTSFNLVYPRPHVFNIARRKRREPGKIYHVRDVGVEATWNVACANHDPALFDGS